MVNEQNIQNLLQKCIDRDIKAQRQLYEMYIDRLYHTTFRITNDHHDTEDVLQQAFIKVFNKLETYRSHSGSIFSWLCRICINEAISLQRKKKIYFLEVTEALPLPDTTSNALDDLSIDYIADAIANLSDVNRIIFTLYEIEGYSHKEISQQLDISEHTSRSYLSRAKSKLQNQLISLNYKVN